MISERPPAYAVVTQRRYRWVSSPPAMISALFKKHMRQPNALEAGGAEIWARVVAHGAGRVFARRLHAGDARAVVGCEFYPAGPAIAGASALCAGGDSRVLSPAYRRLFAQRGAGHDPGRYRRALSLLRPPRWQGDPLRRGGGGGNDGFSRPRLVRPHAAMARLDPDAGDSGAARPLSAAHSRGARQPPGAAGALSLPGGQ